MAGGLDRIGGSSRPGLLAVLAMVGDTPTTSPRKSLAAGRADLGAAAAVLIVGGDVADPGVQPDGVVVGADHLQFSAELVGVAELLQVGPLALDVPEEALDRSLVGGGVRAAEVLDDRAQRQELLVDPEVICGPLSEAASSSGRVGSSTARSTRPSWRAATSPSKPSRSKASVNTTWTWVEVSSALSRVASHLRLTRSTIANAHGAARQRPKWVTSQPHTWLGRYSNQSGQGVRCTGARPAGLGSTRS